MANCATCGTTQELRLYLLRGDDRRRWWCLGCFSLARRLGVDADLAPVWIERAALYRLPLKSIDARFDRRVASAGRRASDRPGTSHVAWTDRREAFGDRGTEPGGA
jgi:hypothetical protein